MHATILPKDFMAEMKKIKEENYLLKNQLYAVVRSLPGSIYFKDKNGVYLGANDHALKMVGLHREEDIIGKTDFDLFTQEEAEQYREADAQVMRTRQELSKEENVVTPDGKSLIQLSIKKPLLDDAGKVIGVLGNTIDITHLKEIERELVIAKEQAEASNRIKTDFIRNMEHDIRTPIGGIWGMMELLQEQEDRPDMKQTLKEIAESAKELLSYCNDIIDFSNIEYGARPLVKQPFHLYKLLDEIIAMELPAAKIKKLDLKLQYTQELPDIVLGDAYRLKRVLINLVSNAVKFTKTGSVEVNAHFEKSVLSKQEREIVIQFIVRDTGIGIPPDKVDFIYEQFAKLSPSNIGLYKGSGLGLRIVKKFMEEMNGDIHVESQLNQGTTFKIFLPFTLPLSKEILSD